MKQFKKFFYIIYFLIIVITASAEFLIDVFQIRYQTLYYTIIPLWAGLMILLMIVEWATENLHIRRLNGRIASLERENTSLKAKMFDQEENMKTGSQYVAPKPGKDGGKKEGEI